MAELLYDRWLVDVPKLMDLAVLYAPGSSQLVAQLLQQLLMLQPKYAQVGSWLRPTACHSSLCVVCSASCASLLVLQSAEAHAACRQQRQVWCCTTAKVVGSSRDPCLCLSASLCMPNTAIDLLHPQQQQLLTLCAGPGCRVACVSAAQDLYSLSTALTGNLHELLESVKHLSNQALAAATAAAPAAATAAKQLLPELAGICQHAHMQLV